MDFVSIAGLRADGRRPLELRYTECAAGTCDRAGCDGSASMAMGLSKVTATVAGPSGMSLLRGEERSLPHVSCSILFAPFCGTVRRFRNRTDGRSLALSQAIETAVLQSVVADVLKYSQIEISLVITEADGSVDCCAINAAMLAVADAGIPLKDLAASCTAGVIQGTHVLDLNHIEETLDCPNVFVTMQPSLNIIVSLRTQKRHTQKDFEQLLEIAMAGCTEVYARMQQALRKRLKQLAVSAGKIES